jgi:hypothetical protein
MFWKSNLDLSEKADVRPLFLELVSKLARVLELAYSTKYGKAHAPTDQIRHGSV